MNSPTPHGDSKPRPSTKNPGIKRLSKDKKLKKRSTETIPIGREIVRLADRCARKMDGTHLSKVQLLAHGLATPKELRLQGAARQLCIAQAYILKAARAMREWAESPAAAKFDAEAKAVRHNTATLTEWCRDKEAMSRETVSKRFPNLSAQVTALTAACMRDAQETAQYKRMGKRKPDVNAVISNRFTALVNLLEAANQTRPAQKVKDAKQEFDSSKDARPPTDDAQDPVG